MIQVTERKMFNFSQQDYVFMQRALMLAKKGHYTTSPNPRVGCVIVCNNEVVGEGYHAKAGEPHAEVNAIEQAGSLTQGATAYVTLEPCSHYGRTPPCAEGLIKAGIKHVIAAMVDPNPKVSGKGLEILEKAGVTTAYGLLEEDARALNLGFIQLMTTGKPYVRCKVAASLDGKTAMANGESQWITSPDARKNVQQLRAQSCAIITGADSVIFDNAKMNVRWEELGELKQSYIKSTVRQPVRVIIDSQNRLTPDLAFFTSESPVLIFNQHIDTKHKWPYFVEQVNVSLNKTKLDLNNVLLELSKRGYNDILIESGARLAGAFIEQNLVDEVILFQAPKLMGSDAKGLVNMPKIESLADAKNLTFTDIRMIGKDIRITATIDKKLTQTKQEN